MAILPLLSVATEERIFLLLSGRVYEPGVADSDWIGRGVCGESENIVRLQTVFRRLAGIDSSQLSMNWLSKLSVVVRPQPQNSEESYG